MTGLQDTATLGVVLVKHCGYTAVVQVPLDAQLTTVVPAQQDIHIEDQPEGGSNALNVNRLVLGHLHDVSLFSSAYLTT